MRKRDAGESEPMPRRRGLSKGLRFEIFKRDGFICRYCGANPTVCALVVDHVLPVVEGGGNDPANLVTSCFECNAGKGGRKLDDKKHTAGIAKEHDHDHADQILEWLEIQRGINAAKREVTDEMVAEWERRVGAVPRQLPARIKGMLAEFGAPGLLEAFDIVASRCGSTDPTDRLKYLHGILRRLRSGEPPPKPPEAQPRRLTRAERVMAHLRAWQNENPAHSMGDICREFTLAAYGSPKQIARPWDPQVVARHVRGLSLESKSSERPGFTTWWVEDVPHHNYGRDAIGDVMTAINLDGADIERLRLLLSEQLAFLDWVTIFGPKKPDDYEDFDEYAEGYLHHCRDELGWPNPKWRA